MEQNWNAKACLSRDWGNLDGNLTTTGSHCPPIWDGFSCFGPTPAGTTASTRCPSFKGSDITKSAFRVCSASGEWLDRYGVPSPVGWTNYTPCLTPEIKEIMRRLGNNDDANTKFNIAVNTRILEFIGLSLSLAALLLSLLIFYYFRTLRNSRTRLHRHLFIAMVVQVGIRLIVYTDQAITRSYDGSSEINTNISENITGENTIYQQQRRGIDNTPILCEASYISLEYARTAMFMWMFVEGLFLHNMITVTVFEEKLSPLVYPIIGWVLPIPLTVSWAVVTHLHYGTATCWWGYNFTLYFWILEGPRLAVLMVNLAFLLNILRVLITKLRQSKSSETQQAMKAVKAALVLLPLLGLTNLLNMLDAPLEKSPFEFALWSYSTHLLTSTQGLVLAFLYCFRNGEVQIAVRKFFRVRILGNSKHTTITKRPIRLSALNNGSLFQNSNNPSQEGSQTLDMANHSSPAVLLSKNNGCKILPLNNHNSYSNNNTNKTSHFSNNRSLENSTHFKYSSHFSSPVGSFNAPPPPLVVRSFSNGVLKQTILRDKSHYSQQSRGEKCHSLYRNSSYLSDDQAGTRPLLQNQQKTSGAEQQPIIPNLASSSLQHLSNQPVVPIPSSSSWSSGTSSLNTNSCSSNSSAAANKQAPDSQEFHQSQNPNNNELCSTSRINKLGKQIAANSWGMLIIPEPLLKRMRGQAQDELATCEKSENRKMIRSCSSNIPRGIELVVREDETLSEEMEQDISLTNTSSSDDCEVRGVEPESFFSLDMTSGEEVEPRNVGDRETNKWDGNPVHISVEILKI